MLYYLTSNQTKFREAQTLMDGFNIKLEGKSIEIPEIQAKDSTEISKFSALYAEKVLTVPFFVMDRSFHIDGLNGFPGPYVKYMNTWFSESNLISLFSNLDTFGAYWQTSIAYSNQPNLNIFQGTLKGTIINRPRGTNGWLFDKFFIPEGLNLTLAELSNEERDNFWTNCSSWKQFSDYLLKEQDSSVDI